MDGFKGIQKHPQELLFRMSTPSTVQETVVGYPGCLSTGSTWTTKAQSCFCSGFFSLSNCCTPPMDPLCLHGKGGYLPCRPDPRITPPPNSPPLPAPHLGVILGAPSTCKVFSAVKRGAVCRTSRAARTCRENLATAPRSGGTSGAPQSKPRYLEGGK